jgi:hypothetical protein
LLSLQNILWGEKNFGGQKYFARPPRAPSRGGLTVRGSRGVTINGPIQKTEWAGRAPRHT